MAKLPSIFLYAEHAWSGKDDDDQDDDELMFKVSMIFLQRISLIVFFH